MSTIIQVKDLNLWYGAHHALHGVNIDIPEHEITALIGFSDKQAERVRIESQEWDFNGFYITGDSRYEISDAVIDLKGGN